MKRSKNVAGMLGACGAVFGIGAGVLAQTSGPAVIGISGATLLENYFRSRASTNDYIDADGNGAARSFPTPVLQQLAPFGFPDPFPNNTVWPAAQHWTVIYAAVGSTNGYQELINLGRTFSTVAGTNPDPLASLRISARTAAYINRYRYIFAGAGATGEPFEDLDLDGVYDVGEPFEDLNGNGMYDAGVGGYFNPNNPAGAPIRETIGTPGGCETQFRALFTSTSVASTQPNEGLTCNGGMTVDIAPLDVPTTWATRQSGNVAFDNNPLQAGYGNNPRIAVDRTGMQVASNGGNTLASLTGGANLSSTPPGVFNPAADANTIFDAQILIAPVGPVVNFGTGVTQIDMSDLRHLFSTGRRASGENLMVVTRDSGSGTRNAWDNSIGLDPSFGVGDNCGARNNSVLNDRLGTAYLPSNKQGNNRVEPSVINHRLGIGYVGPERGISSPGWLIAGQMEIAGVRNNLPSYGGTDYVRPTIDEVLDNDANGWVIFGPSVVASFGDPKSAPEVDGGLGWLEPFEDTNMNGSYDLGEPFNDRNNNTVRDAVEPRPGTVNPAMRNVEAATYINNITRSIDAFVSLPGSDQTAFTPGEFAATQFVLLGAIDNLKQSTPSIDPTVLVANSGLNQALQDFSRTEANNVLESPALLAYGNSVAPVNPANSRAGKVPTREIAAGLYSDQALVPAGNNYITESGTLLAYGTANLPLRNLIAGDFNGDGLRNIGDASDLIGAWRKRNGTPGWVAPSATGALAALATSTGQPATGGDFSIEVVGDFDGNGSFNAPDVRYWADGLAVATSGPNADRLDRKAGFTAIDAAFGGNFFGTIIAGPRSYQPGDSRGDVAGPSGRVARGFAPVGADGRVDCTDVAYVRAQFVGNSFVTDGAANWDNAAEAVGFDLSADVNGDLIVNQADVDELLNIIGCTADFNQDCVVNSQDFFDFLAAFFSSEPSADFNHDLVVNSQDFFDFLAAFFAGCN